MRDQTTALIPFGWDERVAARFHHRPAGPAADGALVGRVVRVERISCIVVTAEGEVVATGAPMPAVGDWVTLALSEGVEGAPFAITEIADRWSDLARRDAMGVTQVLAVNVDLVLVTAPADRVNPTRIEREIAMGWDSGARPIVLVTKHDLAEAGLVDSLRGRLLAVDLIPVSNRTGEGVDVVHALLRPSNTAVLLGPSGAGKSSLANALLGEQRLATGEVREGDSRGRHTTSVRQLVALPGGGVLIDVPGIRSIALADDHGGLEAAFPEIESLLGTCRFNNCEHDHEPGCAVLAAAQAGSILPERLANYLKMRGELAADAEADDPYGTRD